MRTLALALAFAVLTACHTATPKLPDGWSMATEAVGSGTVESADAQSLHVTYSSVKGDVVAQWTTALQDAGWQATPPHGLPGMMTVTFQKGDVTLSMLVSQTTDRADVLLTK